MARLWMPFLVIALADATWPPGLLIANKYGVFYEDMTTGATKTVIPFSSGATYVDFNGHKEIYAILDSGNIRSHRLVRFKFPTNTSTEEECKLSDLPLWCVNDIPCQKYCEASEFNKILEEPKLPQCINRKNLVVDWRRSTIYWSCQDKPNIGNTIYKASSDGSNHTTVKQLKHIDILDMKIDPYTEKLFWLQTKDHGNEFALISSNLDGGDATGIQTFNEPYNKSVIRIILDIQNKKIYLVDRHTHPSHWTPIDYDGTKATMEPILPELLAYDIENVTRSKVYDPRLQTPRLDCSAYNCSKTSSCQLLTWKGVECLNSLDSETSTQLAAGDEGKGSDTINSQADVTTLDDSSKPPVLPHTDGSTKQETQETTEHVTGTTSVDDLTDMTTFYSGVTTMTASGTAGGKDVEGGGNNGEAAETVIAPATPGSGRMAMFFLVAMTIWFAVFVVIFVIKRRVNQANYRPASPSEPMGLLQLKKIFSCVEGRRNTEEVECFPLQPN